jgi:glycosyltransferase involved in cell wall biosynthesis
MALLELFKLLCPATKIIFNTVDLHHLRERRYARIQQDPQAYELSKNSERYEFELLRKADASIVVSSFERQYLEERGFDVVHIPLLQDFRNTPPPGYEGRAGLGFIGEPSHSPNHDAMKSFLSEVWPKLHSSRPELTLSLAGAGWPALLENEKIPGVKLLGRVVGLEHFFDPLMLTIAPLRYGAGTKGKIVSSLGNGVPCVATSIAVEGMDLTEGQHVVVADAATDFANAILSLYDDRDRWEKICKAGLELHRANYSLSHGTSLTYKMLQSAGALPV